ncbi:hypothetical protein EAG_12772 [Camponotus floridanus]|uniref:Uncharacterized protein n=1 Tax=Camponotus floridanus TaxID=104421 RepID=E2AZH4_CAMFO|nr:hypothetical protein EAG_12772 [Camponotus floridanus]
MRIERLWKTNRKQHRLTTRDCALRRLVFPEKARRIYLRLRRDAPARNTWLRAFASRLEKRRDERGVACAGNNHENSLSTTVASIPEVHVSAAVDDIYSGEFSLRTRIADIRRGKTKSGKTQSNSASIIVKSERRDGERKNEKVNRRYTASGSKTTEESIQRRNRDR